MKYVLAVLSAAVIFSSANVSAETIYSGDFRVIYDKYSFSPGVSSHGTALLFRARLGAEPHVFNDRLVFHFEPQFSSINYIVREPMIDDFSTSTIYQIWTLAKLKKNLTLKLGRQEISFGSERVFGTADWGPYGRFFDAARLDYYFNMNSVTAFYARIKQSSGTINRSGGANAFSVEHDLYAAYFRLHPRWVDAVDFYLASDTNGENHSVVNLATYGLRFENRTSNFFSELETTYQHGEYLGSEYKDSNQIDLEIGPVFDVYEGLDLTIEYARATEDFNPLYPSAHEFFGYINYFGRRNIQDIAGHARLRLEGRWHINFDAHSLSAVETSQGDTAYGSSGSTNVVGGRSKLLGTEFDATVEKKWRNVSAAGGAGYFSPGANLTSVGSNVVATNFYYLQSRYSF